MMTLRPLTEEEFGDYRDATIATFAAEKVRSEGVSTEIAREAATAAWDRAAPDGSRDHVIGRLMHDGEACGVMWFVVRPEWGRPCLWLYDIAIDEGHRGKGLGRLAMGFLEAEAGTRQVETIGLHVFGHNDIARSLYESLGFRPTSIVMRKDL